MITISLCMIVKNEEDTLGRCLESVKDLMDEIIIVDTGSTDRTREIASRFTPHIYDFVWVDDFAAARNYSFSKATKEYIFWLDADDILLSQDRAKLMQLKQTMNQSVDVVMMKYDYAFDEWGNVTLSHFRERLLKRSKGFRWVDPVHEWIVLDGNIVKSDICITHKKLHGNSQRNLRIFEKMIADGKEFSPRNVFYYAYELKLNGRKEDAEVYFNRLLDAGMGTENENLNACIELVKYYSEKRDWENLKKTLQRCFAYNRARAEVCCNIGYYYKLVGDYKRAVFWFERATRLKKTDDAWVAAHHDYWAHIPYVELSICHSLMGNKAAAAMYGKMAGQYTTEA